MPKRTVVKDESVKRLRLNKDAKELLLKYCDSTDIHVELNVTYRQVAERLFGWLSRQNIETWNEVVKILNVELVSSKDKCFSGKLSRLISSLDGFHPGVRIAIATSDQVSNRLLLTLTKGKENNLDAEEILVNILRELRELELTDTQINEWMDLARENLDD
jgi:hypothetical protein